MSDTNTTTVKTADVDLNDILGTGAESVMMPGEGGGDKKPHIFSPMRPDTSFLDKPPTPANEPDPANPADPANPDPAPADPAPADPAPADPNPADPAPADPADPDPLAQPGAVAEPNSDDKNKGGRPNNMVSVAKALIDEGLMKPFNDGVKIEDYTAADFEELYKLNLESQRKKMLEEMPQQFFGGMPTEMQQAWQYIADGGQDLKGLFQAMSSSQEIREIDVSTEPGQIYAIRSYLQATNYGTPEEIEDEINSLHDRNELEKKANQFKPKLDAMQQQMVNQRLAVQQQENLQRQEQSQNYMDNVHATLREGELNGIKLDNRTQNMLYAGLVQPNYPSASGRQTNLLGHLLEKYQWVEPDHGRIAEALWLLADPDSYKNEIRSQGANDANVATVRTLKTEQQTSHSGGAELADDNSNASRPAKREGIQRPKRNFFGRD